MNGLRHGEGFIALHDPTAVLKITAEFGQMDQMLFKAAFENCTFAKDPIKFLPMLAASLANKPRFSGQTQFPEFSILAHTYAVGRYLNETGASELIELIGFLHDAGEAFFADIPSPFKLDIDEAREMAIVKAMPYPFLYEFMRSDSMYDAEDYAPVHKADYLSCVVEASRYGHQWAWPKQVMSNHQELGEPLKLMERFIDPAALMQKEALIEKWIHQVRCLLHLTNFDKELS